jgi:hypothetical protein
MEAFHGSTKTYLAQAQLQSNFSHQDFVNKNVHGYAFYLHDNTKTYITTIVYNGWQFLAL